MDYELCKELKDAGFPQKHKEFIAVQYDWVCQHPEAHIVTKECDGCYVPSLSELIEACPRSTDNGLFSLVAIRDKWYCGYEEYEMFTPECIGSTPDIAVARLWLELNKK